MDSPFEYSHIVTTTTHKTLRGPRAGMIFYRTDEKLGFHAKISQAVFPSLQGGPHNNTIAGIATQLKQVASPEFKAYATQIINNSRACAAALVSHGYTLATGGSDNHLLLMDLRPQGVTGNKVQTVCDAVGITLNKNSIYGDKSAISPGGIRLGTPALTSRGMVEADFRTVAGFLHRAIQISIDINRPFAAVATPTEKKFAEALANPSTEIAGAIESLRSDVSTFACGFFMPGSDITPSNVESFKQQFGGH